MLLKGIWVLAGLPLNSELFQSPIYSLLVEVVEVVVSLETDRGEVLVVLEQEVCLLELQHFLQG
jgi:hypothetical protein